MRITRPLAKAAVAALVVTSAFGLVGSSAVTAAPSAEPSLVWLEGELNDGGGSLFFAPFPGFPPTVDWGLTIDAILALNASGKGADPATTSSLDALAAHINDYITGDGFGDPGSVFAGQVGKAMLAALVEGANIHSFGGVDLEALSRSTVTPAGVFAGRFANISAFPDFSNGFGQAFNILALARTPDGVPQSAVDFMLAQQCPGGGFRLFYDAATPADSTRGCASDDEADTDTTALTLEALLTLTPGTTSSAAIARAAAFLIGQQDPVTGGIGGAGPTANPNTNSSGLGAQALAAAGFDDEAARARDFVVSMQLDSARTSGTPAAGDEGAIALNQGELDDALINGIGPAVRAEWQRATTQGVLAFGAAPFAVPRADVVPVQSARLLDTRPGEPTVDGKQAGSGLVPAGSTLVLNVAGRGGVPADAAAVVLNVTAAGGQGNGFVTAFPCDAGRPAASSLNFTAGVEITNQVVTGMAADGTVCLFVGANAVNLIADVGGFFPSASGYQPLTPARVLDTRAGQSTADGQALGAGPVNAGATLTLKVAGRGGVPADGGAAVLNVTATGAAGSGFVTVYPCDSPQPLASSLNFRSSTSVANTVVTNLSATGTVCLFVGGSGPVDLVTDVVGVFPAGSGYHPLTPARVLDTRPGESTVDGKQLGAGASAPGSTLALPVAGRGGVPATATSVVLNVTVDGASGSGFVTVHPCDGPLPLASNLNFVAGASAANGSVVPLAADGTVCLFVGGSSPVHLIVDVGGYFG
jgi:hypothetical protein